MPLRGGLLLGVSQTVMGGKSQGYEYLRIESRPDGVYYVALPSGGKEDVVQARRQDASTPPATATTSSSRSRTRRSSSRGGSSIAARTGGWLYAQVEGKVNGADRQVIYPMRRIDCATGAVIGK